jgi:hypothetical protein
MPNRYDNQYRMASGRVPESAGKRFFLEKEAKTFIRSAWNRKLREAARLMRF